MQYRANVTSGIRQEDIEFNHGHVYVRWDFVRSTRPAQDNEPERTEWNYKEYYMPENEYFSICNGGFGGTWDDALRSVQRSHLYDKADKMIMKYSTDAVDDAKRQQWVEYKREVRATQDQPSYPQTVTYPERPE